MRAPHLVPRVAAALAALVAAASPRVEAQGPPPIPPLPSQSARTRKYALAETLSDDLANGRASAAIELTNPSPGPIDHLELHLYWNGWRNTQATWLREQDRGMGRRSSRHVHQDSYAAIDLRTMRLTARGKGT